MEGKEMEMENFKDWKGLLGERDYLSFSLAYERLVGINIVSILKFIKSVHL